MSEEKEMSFHEKYCQLVMKLNTPKDIKNDFAGFDYRTAEGILKAVKLVCIDLELKNIVVITTEEVEFKEGRFYKRVTATITDGINKYTSTFSAREPESKPKMDESQVSGSASTYGRKYALQNLLMISDDVDPDSLDNSNEGLPKPKQASEVQMKAVSEHAMKLANKLNEEPKAFWNRITTNKFGKSLDLKKMDTAQMATLNRYMNELEKAHSKK
ncbi:ERF family protein [Enterococcus dongliensis]|uniref:ERF family protein n=1 Tax=Enterococcus dongliensis TaxID=2559925 RepID=A0ABU3ERV6_9ENTE|nr:ERF family protein [Enterococcus dongliensis]MDT2597411.1 ERF family protein [Enterococcus dongliensis]